VKDFNFTMASSEGEILGATYSAEKHSIFIDKQEIPLAGDEAPTVHAYVDGSVIELIFSGRMGFTKRFYFKGAAPNISVVFDGAGEMKAWSVRPISTNRLTTPA
jgi:beta-fructofuranosidase